MINQKRTDHNGWPFKTGGVAIIFPTILEMSTATPIGFNLPDFVQSIEEALDKRPSNQVIIQAVSNSAKKICSSDGWLEERFRRGTPDSYNRHLLHKDPRNRFIILSLVWQPGQTTPIHDHSCWGVMGIVENTLEEVCYSRLDDGSRPDYCEIEESSRKQIAKGEVSYLLPPHEEIHRIGNKSEKPTISLHVYGRDLDQINVFDQSTGKVSPMRIKFYSPGIGDAPFVI